MIAVDDILQQLDTAQDDFLFPDLGHGYYYLVDSRLHAYSDADRWAMVVEVVGYNPRAADLIDVLHVFGNCLTSGGPGYDNGEFLGRVDNIAELEDEDEPEIYVGNVPIKVRGQLLEVSTPRGAELIDAFRSLTPRHRDLLLAEESELRRRIPTDLPEILRLDEWHQPDLFEVAPSASETYRLLAESIAHADPTRYVPTQAPNTHWSNWPESGSL